MHQTISALVWADTPEEAHEIADDVFQGLCENQYPFDYYTMFDNKQVMTDDEKIPAVVKAASKIGQRLIREGMEATKQYFMEYIKKVREILSKYSDDQIFTGDIPVDPTNQPYESFDNTHFRYFCLKMGQERSNCVWLYSQEGEGIVTPDDLKNILEGWPDLYKDQPSPFKGKTLFVVPADVHS